MRWFRTIHKPTLICCCIVLFCSIYPGHLVGLFEGLSLVAMDVFLFNPFAWLLAPIVIALVWGIVQMRRSNQRGYSSKRTRADTIQRSMFATAIVVMTTVYLVLLKIPLLLGFGVSRPYFSRYLAQDLAQNLEQNLAQAETASSTELTETRQQLSAWRRLAQAGRLSLNEPFLGLYGVSEIGIDAHGGTYFVIATQGVISTQTYYGIAHRPQRQTPFGHENYRSRRIMGDWYEFKVVDEQSGR